LVKKIPKKKAGRWVFMSESNLDSEKIHDISKTLISFVKISKNRLSILRELEGKTLFPSEIVEHLNITFSTVSKSLKQLKAKELIICDTPTLYKGKLYSLTNKGKQILNLLNDK
jgi:predicted transcriptional regulator